jgi:hypothetical protein
MTRRTLISAAVALLVAVSAAPARAAWTWPVSGEVITPYRNGDDPYAAGQHRGIDIAATPGTPVVAAVAGEVRFAATAGTSGLTVSIRTADARYDTSYLHLSEVAVREAQTVAAGERIGAVGTTGRRSAERAHLHFGVRDAGSHHAYHDPLGFLPPPPVPSPRPAPAPAPDPSPIPLAPRPEPVPTPRSRPAPSRRRPAPRPAPVPRRVPAGHPLPRAHRVPSPVRPLVPRPAHAAGPRRAPATPHSSPAPASHPADDRAAAEGPRPHRPPAIGADAPSRDAPGPDAPGPDAGWVLACLGLLAAAAVIGLTGNGREGTRGAARSTRDRIAALVNPQPGGR